MITIRPYTDADWNAICQVHDSARRAELRGSRHPSAFIPLADDPNAADLRRVRKWVACDDKQVVGFVGIEADYPAWLYIDPACYGKGIGRDLLRLALAEMEPHASAIVLAGDDWAQTLYGSKRPEVKRTVESKNTDYRIAA